MSSSPPTRYLSIAETAEYAGVCQKTVRRLIAKGNLGAHRVGPRLIRIALPDAEAIFRPIPTTEAVGA